MECTWILSPNMDNVFLDFGPLTKCFVSKFGLLLSAVSWLTSMSLQLFVVFEMTGCFGADISLMFCYPVRGHTRPISQHIRSSPEYTSHDSDIIFLPSCPLSSCSEVRLTYNMTFFSKEKHWLHWFHFMELWSIWKNTK